MNKKSSFFKIVSIVLIAAAIIINEYLITSIALAVGGKKTLGIMIEDKMHKIFPPKKLSGSVVDIVLSHGMPEVYGTELNVNFDKVQESMNIMKMYDQTYGDGRLKLNADQMKRYIKIGKMIACEFCCSATTMVFDDGKAACGCAHSQAMRGLLAYLIEKHGSEYTDEQILHELAKWKGVYFPKQMVDKVMREVASGNYSPDIAALLNNVDKEKLKSNIKNAPSAPATSAQPLPGQQGGC